MKVKWSNRAIDCVQEISDYIALDNPTAAEKWVDNIFDKVQILSSTPEIGRIVFELSMDSVRELIFGNYRIIYQIHDKVVLIIAVRNFKQILSIDVGGL